MTIWMVHNGDANHFPELASRLGARYVHCGTPSADNNSACLSNVDNGTHHMKNWYFSHTMVADALARITQYEEGCTLGVGTLNMTRSTIYTQLERIKALGCEVRVITGTALPDDKEARLDAAGIPHRQIKTTRNGHPVSLHSKMMVYRGYYDTPVAQHPKENRGWVWTGSQNFTFTPLKFRDDVFVGISRGGVTTNYSDYFEVMWANGT